MATRTSLISSDISSGLAAAIRSAREVDLSDPMDAIRRIDVTRGIDVGREVVGDATGALAETVARFPVRGRRRSRRRPALIGLAIAIIGAVVLAGWWLRRQPADDVTPEDERLDRDAVERAADEGMGTAIGSPPEPFSRPGWVPVAVGKTAAD